MNYGIDGVYGNNCKAFVRRVCREEGWGELLFTVNERTLAAAPGLTLVKNGQLLNDQSGDRGPTPEELRDIVFANACSGDIVQMYWHKT